MFLSFCTPPCWLERQYMCLLIQPVLFVYCELCLTTKYADPRLQIHTTSLNWTVVNHQWSHLCNIEPINVDTSEIAVLFWRDVLRVHDVLDSRYPADSVEAPDRLKTHFVWCVTGPVATSALHPPLHINTLSITQQLKDQVLPDLVNQYGFACIRDFF